MRRSTPRSIIAMGGSGSGLLLRMMPARDRDYTDLVIPPSIRMFCPVI
jgi:hypothetical protein